ncbi:hypothetical protein CGZ93_02210 [Enemella dayhoffiae]|uniref:Four-carbon acid sugar kinase family protein n=1 Tax=Enemella dayhoffiae TaxID=2016507 RepID=A0A255HBB7_9ACTN|nr:four-carbon acid sugar kinase family protein [Enemella dayhoffiae]OYO25278.1 hypothetical protein CGZ93_02210 [Enemella dayhoffiae]
MTATGTPELSTILAQAPKPVADPGRRAEIRELRERQGRRTVALDDDPTGSQSVHGVEVVTVLERGEYAAALTEPGATAFLLTNSRSLPRNVAESQNFKLGEGIFALAMQGDWPVDVVSRSDSTLRGHVLTEVNALDRARAEAYGSGFDGVLLVPTYLEAGRFTAGDVHWAMVGGNPVPVGETEFARDKTFGYRSSSLVDFLAEVSGGELGGDRVRSLSLELIRSGGVDAVADALRSTAEPVEGPRPEPVEGPTWFVVNATDYADLETVALAVHRVQAEGRSFLSRSGPSFVRALSGIEPREVLTAEDIWPDGRTGGGHGLLVVGSHVGLTGQQLAKARARGGLVEVELSVPELLGDDATAHVQATAGLVTRALQHSDVLLLTSREVISTDDREESLAIARTVSQAIVDVVQQVRRAEPAWVVAKGGITSHDVAVRGLGIRRGIVLGQLFQGMVSVLRAVDAPQEVVGVPYVVFAGNVGDENALADVLRRFSQTTEQGGK